MEDEEEAEGLYLIAYRCPRCMGEWTEEWSCACDSECPNCDLRHIEALAYVVCYTGEVTNFDIAELDREVKEAKERYGFR